MQHATLYKRSKTGAIVFWKVATNDGTITKTTGQLGTSNPTTHSEICKPKNVGRSNETTPLQQAESQALSDWTKKHQEGYKSLTDLGLREESVVDLLGTLQVCLPTFNTTGDGSVLPMLAQAVNWNKVTYPCLVQPKLDGVRALMIVKEDSIEILSRNGKPYTTLAHIQEDVEGYLDNNRGSDAFILDGEIYAEPNELSFQEIIAAVKKQRPDSLKLKFRAYDIVNDEKQEARWESTVRLVDSINSHLVKLVECVPGINQLQIKSLHDGWVSQGNEGAMIRLLDGKYGQGQRSSHLLKVKEFDEAEFECTGLGSGQREEDLVATCETKEGQSFNAKLVGNREYKAELMRTWDNKRKNLTVKFFGWTDSNLPRFPIGVGFRDYE